MKKLTIIIVTWNSEKTLSLCVDSIFKFCLDLEFDLIIVDNDSKNKEYLKKHEELKNVKVIYNSHNSGYSSAINKAIGKSETDYVTILNPDIIFVENNLLQLLNLIEKNDKIGVIGPLLYDVNDKPQILNFYPRFPTIWQYIVLRSVLCKLFNWSFLNVLFFHSKITENKMNFVDQIPGAYMLFNKHIFGIPKPFSEDYFIWFEDVDFCYRLKKMGKRVAVCSDKKAIHIGGVSFKLWSRRRQKIQFNESFIKYCDKYFSKTMNNIQKLLIIGNAAATLILTSIVYLLKLNISSIRESAVIETKIMRMVISSFTAVSK